MSKLTACKACEKEIAKGVKKCPSCGKDQRNWFMKHKILSFIGAIIFISIIGSSLGGEDTAESTEADVQTAGAESEPAPEEQETAFQVGDTITDDQLEITVTKFEEKDVVGDPDFLGKEVSEGGIFVAIQYKLKNISDEPVGMFDYPTIKLVDENGVEYESDIDASGSYAGETGIDNSKILSDLNPDISVNDTEVYEISKEKFAQGKWHLQIGEAKVEIK